MLRLLTITFAVVIIVSLSFAWRAQDRADAAAATANDNRIENCYQTELIRRLLGDRAGPVTDHHKRMCRGLDFSVAPKGAQP